MIPASTEIRVRFAPSPTGFLHIGGVRTALYNWLYAKGRGGKFLLRIEDTDQERSEAGFTQDILASMKWLGLEPDEEVIYQSHRMDVYRARAEELIERGLAYRCYSTEAEITAMRERATAEGKKPMYDRTWRDRSSADAPAGAPYVIRAKIPLDGHVEFEDLIRGPIRFENTELDDYVLIRSSGAPTYNFSCVIDDVEQRITHVIRGDDHINNTPKQLHLYRFFNYPQAKFAHLPMILGADKKKLSKRHGAVSANQYRVDGYLPETILNFLSRIGWSHGDQEIFTIEELIRFFDFDHVQKASGVFAVEKLIWLSGEHLRRADPARLAAIIAQDFAEVFGGDARALAKVGSPTGIALVTLIQQKVKTLREIAEQLGPLVQPGTVTVDPSALKWNKDEALKRNTKAAVAEILETLSEKMQGKTDSVSESATGPDSAWGSSASLGSKGLTHDSIDAVLRTIGEKHGVKLGDVVQPMRLTVSGKMVSASLFDLVATLPWELVRARLAQVSEL